MSFAERLHLTWAETFYAVMLPVLGVAAIVSFIFCVRTSPGLLAWSGSVIDIAMFVSIEAVLIKVLRTPSDINSAISDRAVIDLIVGSAIVVVLGTILALIAIWLLNGNERSINSGITAIVGLLLIFISAGLSFMQRSRLNQHNKAANSTR